MSKDKIVGTCVLVCSLLMTSTVQAEEGYLTDSGRCTIDHCPSTTDDYLKGFSNKLSQGLANMAFGFIEIPKNVINISNEQNIFVGLTWGVIRGVVQGVSRMFMGGVEFITSPIPSGEFASPAYVWDRFSEDSRYFGLHYPGYWTIYGPLDDGE